MGVRIKTKFNRLPEIRHNAEALNGTSVQVGVLEGENAWLAGIHEYGCNIEITPKMRAWLHYNGLHVKDSTKYIKIPERAFLRNGYDENRDTVVKKSSTLLPDVLEGKISIEAFLDFVGTILSSKIRVDVRNLSSPPNHPFTTERKGSSNPLVDTGNMIDGINWQRGS